MLTSDEGAIVVIDGANIMHRCNSAWFSSRGGSPITDPSELDGWPVVYVFLRSLRSIIEDVLPASRLVYALDSRPKFRIDFFSGYKLKRRLKHQADAEALAEANLQSPETALLVNWELRQLRRCETLVREVLPFVPLGWDGYEADDICAAVAESFPEKKVIVISGDSDMKQLTVLPNVYVYNLNTKPRSFLQALDPDDPADQDPARWKAIIGDKTDEIPGITAEKTARKLLFNEVEFQKALDTKKCRSVIDKGKTWREVYDRNIRLVSLLGKNRLFPLPPTEEVRKVILETIPRFDEDVYALAATQMKFDSWQSPDGPTTEWLKQVNTWQKIVPRPLN